MIFIKLVYRRDDLLQCIKMCTFIKLGFPAITTILLIQIFILNWLDSMSEY
jgi:hypothetical protein